MILVTIKRSFVAAGLCLQNCKCILRRDIEPTSVLQRRKRAAVYKGHTTVLQIKKHTERQGELRLS